jgi:hypothetical protein
VLVLLGNGQGAIGAARVHNDDFLRPLQGLQSGCQAIGFVQGDHDH